MSVLNLDRRSLTDTGSADETFVIHAGPKLGVDALTPNSADYF